MDKDLITYNRHIPDDAKIVYRNGYIFIAHPTIRFGPLAGLAGSAGGILSSVGGVAMKVLPLLGQFGGSMAGMKATEAEGEDAMEIARIRADIDIENAEAARRLAVETAKLTRTKGQRLLATQVVEAAAGNIKVNVGVPLVIKAETKKNITKDIGFILERGREESKFFRTRAALEIYEGKLRKRKSSFDALSQGLGIAGMGLDLFKDIGGFSGLLNFFGGGGSSLPAGAGSFGGANLATSFEQGR